MNDNYIAKSLLGYDEYDCFKPDNIIKSIFPETEFYIDRGDYIMILIKTNKTKEQIPMGNRYSYYYVNGVLYDNFNTSSMKHLKMIYKRLKPQFQQLSLF